MSRGTIDLDDLYDIGDAIRSKLGVTTTYRPDQMAGAIESIEGGGITPTGTKDINSNGIFDVTQFASAAVNVPTPHMTTPEVLTSGANAMYTSYSSSMASPGINVRLLVMTMVNQLDNMALDEPTVKLNNTRQESYTTKYHLMPNSTGTDNRCYRIDVYNLAWNQGDNLSISFTTQYLHSSYMYAFISEDFDIGKVMSSAGAATSGSDSADGCVIYGTFNDDAGGSVSGADYTANTTVTTADPGSGYRSSFIIWLRGKYSMESGV